MKRFLVVVEKAARNYSAYSPDLPGCAATGKTIDEALANMQAAVELHLHGLAEDGLPIPEPTAIAEYVAISSAA